MRMIGLWMAAIGCGPGIGDPEGFANEFAGIWCDREETCALGDFEESYSSQEDCFSDRSDDPRIENSDESGCTIDVEAADRCLAFMHDAPCADWDDKQIEEECQDVYTEC